MALCLFRNEDPQRNRVPFVRTDLAPPETLRRSQCNLPVAVERNLRLSNRRKLHFAPLGTSRTAGYGHIHQARHRCLGGVMSRRRIASFCLFNLPHSIQRDDFSRRICGHRRGRQHEKEQDLLKDFFHILLSFILNSIIRQLPSPDIDVTPPLPLFFPF